MERENRRWPRRKEGRRLKPVKKNNFFFRKKLEREKGKEAAMRAGLDHV
jgi:hypothetical protein